MHVRQYEKWGPLFIPLSVPLYWAASVIAWRKGLDPYLDNPFEVEAYGETD